MKNKSEDSFGSVTIFKKHMRPNPWNLKNQGWKVPYKPEFCSFKAYAFMESLLYKG